MGSLLLMIPLICCGIPLLGLGILLIGIAINLGSRSLSRLVGG